MLFTEEHELLRKSLRAFFEREINPHVEQWEEAQIFPAHEVFKKLGKEGYLGLTKPEEFGGAGLDYSYAIVLAEELGRIPSGGVSLAIGVQTDMCTPALARYGSDELRREWLAPSIAGDLVGCIGVSEVGSGSDVASLKTTARKDGDDYIINGGKMWITNGIQADWMCCLVNTSDDKAHKNKSLIVVPMNTPGVERARKLHKLGMWSSDTAQVFFDDVRVPQRYRIGPEGAGFMLQMLQFQEERLWGAANSITAMDEAISETVKYTRDRKAFGKSILDNQVVHFRLAELTTEVECLRALVYRAAELFLSGKDVTRLASMCKLKGGRLVREVSDSCIQYWGGMGYMWESKISRMFRDSRLASIGGGADEVMLSIICKLDGMLPGKS
ncbi:MAG: acyl-CoA dehydrogenase family protein [Nannocystis sp.]|nr:acyl-CoA dehydrogenase family protein [Nannocystis sp.]MBA3546229.1 acyl-CoA dehydrogenase family protein [Nannocystis sp.]